MIRLLRALSLVLFQDLIIIRDSEQILIRKEFIAEGIRIECLSNESLKYSFKSESIEGTSADIAACERCKETCYLREWTTKTTFEISAIKGGGQLRILHLNEDVYGTYTCCETYATHNCNSTTVDIRDIVTTTKKSTDSANVELNKVSINSNDANGREVPTAWMVVTICILVLFVGILIIAISLAMRLRRVKKQMRTRENLEIQLAETGLLSGEAIPRAYPSREADNYNERDLHENTPEQQSMMGSIQVTGICRVSFSGCGQCSNQPTGQFSKVKASKKIKNSTH